MDDFNTALIREKIDVKAQAGALPGSDSGQVTVRSNRICLNLDDGVRQEKIVIRSQNMHSTLRIAARTMADFYKHGFFTGRAQPMDWKDLWHGLQYNYEREFNPQHWCAIYIDGKVVFRTQPSVVVDVIEKCALVSAENYDATMKITEQAFGKLGKPVQIEHSSIVAAMLNDDGAQLRCGIILRAGGKDTVFTFTVTGGQAEMRIPQTFDIAAGLLEAVNLCRIVRGLQEKVLEATVRNHAEVNQLRAATGRLITLDKMINTFNDVYDVSYLPEKPTFFSSPTLKDNSIWIHIR